MKLHDQEHNRELQPADLRGILKYVPQWRGHVFVIAIDGSVVDEDNFGNIMLEVAVLRNLGIRVVLVYGIGAQLERLAQERGQRITDARGYGPTDEATLRLAVEAAALLGHRIQRGLSQNGLRCALSNVVRATERGIIGGVDHLRAGKVERIQAELIHRMLELELVPVISPVACTREGVELRLNSDHLASELARELKASKLIFLLPYPGLTYRGKFRLNADVNEVRRLLDKDPETIDEPVRSKARHAVKTIDSGTPRAHIIDCRIHDGMLLEVFSKVGIGSMIHSNPYAQIRPARKKDASAIHALTRGGVRDEELRPRTRQSIEQAIGEYYVYEIDESIIGCFRLTEFPRNKTVELASVFVHPAYHGRHIGSLMVAFAIAETTRRGKQRIVALTTQSLPFFRDQCGFRMGDPADLPKALREIHASSCRKAHIVIHQIGR
jgi:amino-acid N-acetyltransferase